MRKGVKRSNNVEIHPGVIYIARCISILLEHLF